MASKTISIIVKSVEILVVISVLLLSFSYIYFRYFKETTFRPVDPLTTSLAKEVNNSLDAENLIVGAQVVRINLRKNIRYVVHTHWKIPELQKIYDKFSSDRITAQFPVFSDDDIQNARTIKLMNHEFDCVRHEDTLSYKLAPTSIEHIKVTCSISIPPAFNELKGMISVHLSKKPTSEELVIIENILIDLSEKIYMEFK